MPNRCPHWVIPNSADGQCSYEEGHSEVHAVVLAYPSIGKASVITNA